jgi:hypothetical protein
MLSRGLSSKCTASPRIKDLYVLVVRAMDGKRLATHILRRMAWKKLSVGAW